MHAQIDQPNPPVSPMRDIAQAGLRHAAQPDTGWLPLVLRIVGGAGLISTVIIGLTSNLLVPTKLQMVALSVVSCVLLFTGAAIVDALRRIEYNTRRRR